MKKINCAVIGMGVGERHARFYQEFNHTNLVKIYEKNKKLINTLKKKYPKVEFVHSENEIIDDKNVELVSIASYDNFHSNQIIKCFKQNKNVFVEKPICLNLKELKNIVKYFNKSKSKISCNLILRSNSQFNKIKKICRSKKFGKIFYIEGDYNYGRLKKIKDGWRGKIPFYSVTYGGGVHIIDLVNWMLQELPSQVKAEANKMVTKNSSFKYNDFSTALLKYKSGRIAKITSNFGCAMPHHHSMNVFGSKSTIIHNLNGTNIYYSRNKKIKPKKLTTPLNKKEKNNILKDFVLSLVGKNKNTLISFKEILNAMLICFAIEKSFNSNKNIKLDYNKLKLI